MSQNAIDMKSETMEAIAKEVVRARIKHPVPFHSSHEGYAIIKEEFDEMWKEVMKQSDERSYARLRIEAIQTAAMCIRMIEDVCDQHVPSAMRNIRPDHE